MITNAISFISFDFFFVFIGRIAFDIVSTFPNNSDKLKRRHNFAAYNPRIASYPVDIELEYFGMFEVLTGQEWMNFHFRIARKPFYRQCVQRQHLQLFVKCLTLSHPIGLEPQELEELVELEQEHLRLYYEVVDSVYYKNN